MTSTFRRHFDEDISRAESLLVLANGAAPVTRKGRRADEIRLSAVAMAVGAMDAYFCDAYVDCLARRLQSFKSGVLGLPTSYAQFFVEFLVVFRLGARSVVQLLPT